MEQYSFTPNVDRMNRLAAAAESHTGFTAFITNGVAGPQDRREDARVRGLSSRRPAGRGTYRLASQVGRKLAELAVQLTVYGSSSNGH